MRLTVSTPTEVIVDMDVAYVQAEDPSGRFGVLTGHERFLTALAPSILVYRRERNGADAYIAVRRGVLRVSEDKVFVAAREAHQGDSLDALQELVRKAREQRGGMVYRSSRSLYQMQLAAWRRLMEYEDVGARS